MNRRLAAALFLLGLGLPSHAKSTDLIAWGAAHLLPGKPTSFAGGSGIAGAVLEGGSISIWGNITDSAILPPSDLPPVRQLAIGSAIGAVLEDGTLRFWGKDAGLLKPPMALMPVRKLSITSSHALAILEDSTVAEWGNLPPEYLKHPSDLKGVVDVATGARFSVALKADGSVVAWGDSILGAGYSPNLAKKAVAISAGGGHALALLEDGTVQAWGNNRAQFLCTNVPKGLDSVRSIQARGNYSVVVRANGKMVGWGDNGYHQLDFPFGSDSLWNFGLGDEFGYGIKSDGKILNWGFQAMGRSARTFTLPNDLPDLKEIAATSACIFALSESGKVFGWGSYNYRGILDIPHFASPVSTISINQSNHALALMQDGTVVAWGDSSKGQTKVPANLRNAIAISAGCDHSLALDNSGKLYSWGDTARGLQSLPIGHASQIAAGCNHSLAVDSLGRVRCWGDNSFNQCSVPGDLGEVTELAAGYAYSMALRKDGSVRIWGDGMPTDSLGGIDRISDGGGYGGIFALRNDGSLWAYGNDYYGSISQAKYLPPLRAVAGGFGFGVGLRKSQSPTQINQATRTHRNLPAGRHAVRIYGIDGRVRLSTIATWDGRKWSLQEQPRGVVVLKVDESGFRDMEWKLSFLR